MADQADGPESDTLHVGNLPIHTSEELVKLICGPTVADVQIKSQGGGDCTAIVKFTTVADAVNVRKTLDAQVLQGLDKPLIIRFVGGGAAGGPYGAPPPATAGGAAPSGSPPSALVMPPGTVPEVQSDTLYIIGLPTGTTNEAAKELFDQYGQVITCHVLGMAAGGALAAIVKYQTPEQASSVRASLHGMMVTGAPTTLKIVSIREKAPSCPSCSGAMQWTDFAEGGYSLGWRCNYFTTCGSTDQGQGKWRWFCMPCQQDLCAPCQIKQDGGPVAAYKPPPTFTSQKGYSGGKGSWETPPPPAAPALGGNAGHWGGGKGSSYGSYGKGQSGKSSGMQSAIFAFMQEGRLPGAGLGHDDNALHIGGLPLDCEDLDLFHLFSPFGALAPSGVRAMKNPDGSCRGFGFVNYVQPESMQGAIAKLHGTSLPDGTILSVQPKRSAKVVAPEGVGNGMSLMV